jgi:nucleotide-binding universal stress UspA family protein
MTAAHEPHARVVAAVDPRREDRGPAALGLLLAKLTGAPLVLAAAYAVDGSVDLHYPAYAEALRGETEQRLESERTWAAARAGGVDVSTAAIAVTASPAAAIQQLAEESNAAMIVVGSSDRGHAGRVQPGAVTDRLLHGAPCPVAVATKDFDRDELRLIGAAFVDRADARAALRYACDLATAAGALVRVLTVREPTDWHFSGALDAETLAAVERTSDEVAERTLRAGLDAVPESRADGGTILVGRPQDVLATASADLDLLVCGSRGYGPLRTLLLGGVSHALVRQAQCPVLVVPTQD